MDVEHTLPRRVRGLTLIELLTTVGVMAISLSLLAPGWSSVIEGNQVTKAANTLLTDLRYARNTAVTRNEFVSLCPSRDQSTCSGDPEDWQEGYLVFVDADGNRQRAASETLLRVQDAQQRGLRIHSSAGRPAIRFRDDGAAWSTNTTFRVCAREKDTKNRAVVLYGSGRARVDRVMPGSGPVRCS